jgi:hypothetical protein
MFWTRKNSGHSASKFFQYREINANWQRLVQRIGWINALLYATNWVLHHFSPILSLHRYYVVAQPIPEQNLLPPEKGKSIVVRQIDRQDPMISRIPRSAKEIRARYDAGAICFGAFREGKLLGYLWVLFSAYREPEYRCIMNPLPTGQVAWDFDLYIDPSERLGLTFAKLWDAANTYLRAHDIRWTLSRVSAFAFVSIASHR